MPRTLAQNAQYIANTIKPAIKSAIEAQGVTVPSTDSFLDYADRIGEIEGGGSGYQLKDLPTGSISTVTDAAPLPLNALKVSVEAWQEGSGDPSPSNVRPIHGWDSGEITVEGNQLPMTVDGIKSANSGATWTGNSTVINGVIFTILTDSDGNVTGINANGTASDGATFNIIDNASMSLSGKYRLLSNQHLSDRVCAYTFDFSNHVDIDIKSNQDVIETFDNNILTHVHIYIWAGNTADNWIFTPMMFQLKGYTQQFPQKIYGAEWDVVNGGMKDKVLVGNGNEIASDWQIVVGTSSTGVKYADLNFGDNYINDSEGISSHYKWISQDTVGVDGSFRVYQLQLTVYDNRFIDKATAISILNSENPKFIVPAYTPTAISLSPLSIRLLEGTNNLYADCGEVIEGEYFVGETKAYDLVEYIESDGTQVIDTGRQVVQGQTLEITFEGSSNQTAYAWILGGITSSNYYGYQFPNSSAIYLYNGGTSASSQSGFSSDVLTQKALTFNGSANANIHILGLWDGSAYSNQGKFKVYSLDINGDFFVPAKRRRDGVYGLYDIANSQFLTDVASGNPLTGGESLGIRIG